MDRIDNVAVFAEVAERGSFAEAARHLNRSPAAVTRAVAELEARLGVRLLNRTTRAVSVTETGQRFLAGARRVLADLAEIEQAAIGQGSAPRGELRVTAPIVFGRRHVLPLVTDFLAQFPEVERAAGACSTGRSIWSRRASTSRSASVRWPTPRRSRRGSARCGGSWSRRRPISSGAAGRRRRAISPRTMSSPSSGMDGIERWRFAGGVEAPIKPRLIVNTAEAAIDAAVSGFGITRVLSYQAVDALADKSLVRLLREHEGDEIPVHVVYPDGRHPPPKLRAFLDALVPRLRQRCDRIAKSLIGQGPS